MRELLQQAGAHGEADARVFSEEPQALERMGLADFGAGGPGEAALRRALHALHVPPGPFRLACRLLRVRRGERALAAAERYAYWQGARRTLDRETWRRLTRGTTILMYHALGRPGEPASRFVVPGHRFERQLRWLARRRRPVLGLDDLVRFRREGRLPPAGAVVITLDDGYVDTRELGAPLLRRFGFPATVFAVSGRVGESADWDGARELSRRPLLDWDGLVDLQQDGVMVGAHTRTHPRLPELGVQEASEEIEQSRTGLAERLGAPIRSFAYPYGRTSSETVAAVARAGFSSACGIERGLNYPGTPLLELRRVPVDGDASMLRFALAVRFGDADLLARALGRLRDAVPSRAARRRARALVQRSGG